MANNKRKVNIMARAKKAAHEEPMEQVLWTAANKLRKNMDAAEYKHVVLGLIFLKYISDSFNDLYEKLKNGAGEYEGADPEDPNEYRAENVFYVPEKARWPYLQGRAKLGTIGKDVDDAMEAIEDLNPGLRGVLPKEYAKEKLDKQSLGGLIDLIGTIALGDSVSKSKDLLGRVYEYFLGQFALAEGKKGGQFYTPSCVVQLLVEILEPYQGRVFDPCCGSGGMFVQSEKFVNAHSDVYRKQGSAFDNLFDKVVSIYGQESNQTTWRLCKMNLAIRGIDSSNVRWNNEGSFLNDAHQDLKADFIIANPPFNVDKVKSESTASAGRLPFGMPSVNPSKEVSNANYLWISYFYSYLNEHGRAGFVMAASATDSNGRDRDIRRQLVSTGAVDVMLSVGTNFFYTKSLPCTLWFFDKGKKLDLRDKVLFIDSRNYYTAVDRTLNEWSPWQMKNLNAIVWLHRGETEKYHALVADYRVALDMAADCTFAQRAEQLQQEIASVTAECKDAVAAAARKDKKRIQAQYDEFLAAIQEKLTIAKEACWLTDKFGDGEYRDIPGLCKAATLQEIEEKNWSLTPGAYVGVEAQQTDDVDFAERMHEIHAELLTLQQQSDALMETISRNWEEMGV